MNAVTLNKALKTKKLDKYLELFPGDHKYDKLNKWEATSLQEPDPENVYPNLKNGEILICGYPALSGSVLLTEYDKEELLQYFPTLFIQQIFDLEETVETHITLLSEKLKNFPDGYCYRMGEGGLNKALYQLGKDSGIGFKVFHEDIPVHQESIEICEYYNLDPWSLFSAGCALIVSDRSRQIMEELKELGLMVKRVGYMTNDKEKFICHKTINSRVNRPAPDGLLQVLQEKLATWEGTLL